MMIIRNSVAVDFDVASPWFATGNMMVHTLTGATTYRDEEHLQAPRGLSEISRQHIVTMEGSTVFT